MIKTATIFRHCRADPSGTIGKVLRRRNIAVTGIGTPFESLEGFDVSAPDLLVVMGGACGVYQAGLYPFLEAERRIIGQRLEAGRPVLGICLGAQLMAAALGAEVHKGDAGPEKGWHPVNVTQAGRNTPARHFDAALTQVMQWHGDTFTAPPGAVLLAGSEKYPHQMFQAGTNSIGIQFHPEVDEEVFREWCVDAAYDAYSGQIDLGGMMETAAQYLPVMERQTTIFLNEWLDQIADSV
jgi:GMP synthase (glutamine-hydrolysing)